jgi:ABC-type Fe3+ transport system permease subunit
MLRITEIGMKWVIPGLLALWLGLLLIGTIRGYPVLVTTSDDFHRDPTWGSWFIAAFIAVIVGGLSFLGGWAVSRYRNSEADTTELLPRTRPDDLVGIMLRITEIGMKWVIPGLLALWLGLVLIGTIRGYQVLAWTADDFDRSHSNHDSGSGLLNPVWGSWFIAVIAGGLSFLGGWAVSKYGKGRQ